MSKAEADTTGITGGHDDAAIPTLPGETMTTLISGILMDAQHLVRQQLEMLKAELHEDFKLSKRAAELGGLGIVLLTVGILGLVTALAYFLHEYFQSPMWIAWAITGGILLFIGAVLAIVSYSLLERFSPVPRKTLHAIRETFQWKTK